MHHSQIPLRVPLCFTVVSVFSYYFADTKTKFRDITRLLMNDVIPAEPQVSHLFFILCCLFDLDYALLGQKKRNQEVTQLSRKTEASYTYFVQVRSKRNYTRLKNRSFYSFIGFICSFKIVSHCVDHVGLVLIGHIFLTIRSFQNDKLYK